MLETAVAFAVGIVCGLVAGFILTLPELWAMLKAKRGYRRAMRKFLKAADKDPAIKSLLQ